MRRGSRIKLSIVVSLAALSLGGCGVVPTPNFERLDVDAIPTLTSFAAGKVFRPFRWDFDDSLRYPLPAPGKAPDPLCWLGDSWFTDCVICECDAALACPTGWTCRDVRFAFESPPDAPIDEGALRHRWPAYHLATCIR